MFLEKYPIKLQKMHYKTQNPKKTDDETRVREYQKTNHDDKPEMSENIAKMFC